METSELIQQKLRELEILAHSANVPLDVMVMVMQRQFYFAALERNGGNKCKTAREMGLHRNTVSRSLKLLAQAKKIRPTRPDKYAMTEEEWSRAKRPASSVTLKEMSRGMSNS